MNRKLFGREPALWINVIAAVLGLVVTLQMSWLDVSDATNIVAFLTAAAGVTTAWQTRPWSVSLFTGLISTLAVLAAGYGLDFTQEQVGMVQLIAASILTLVARGEISPKPDASASRSVRMGSGPPPL